MEVNEARPTALLGGGVWPVAPSADGTLGANQILKELKVKTGAKKDLDW
jgi:hypothetical protein